MTTLMCRAYTQHVYIISIVDIMTKWVTANNATVETIIRGVAPWWSGENAALTHEA